MAAVIFSDKGSLKNKPINTNKETQKNAETEDHLQALIQSKKTEEEIYRLGNAFRRGEMPEYPIDSKKAILAALRCYHTLLERDYETDELHHNLGILYNALGARIFKEERAHFYNCAAKHFSKSKLEASKKNLKKMEEDGKIKIRKSDNPNALAVAAINDIISEERPDLAVAAALGNFQSMISGALEGFQNKLLNLVPEEERKLIKQKMKKDLNNFNKRTATNVNDTTLEFRKSIDQMKHTIATGDRHTVPLMMDDDRQKKLERDSDLFTEEHLASMRRVSEEILGCINQNGGAEKLILIPLGASTLWYVETLKAMGYKGQIIWSPISDIHDLSLEDSQLQFYKAFLESRGLSNTFFEKAGNQDKQILLLDSVISGSSLVNFRAILKSIDSRFKKTKLLGIREPGYNSPYLYHFPTISVDKETFKATEAYRLGVRFVAKDWHKWQTTQFECDSAIIRKRKKQIVDFVTRPLLTVTSTGTAAANATGASTTNDNATATANIAVAERTSVNAKRNTNK